MKLITFLFAILCLSTHAQNLSVKNTTEISFNAKDLYLYRFLGEDDQHFYTLFSNDTTSGKLEKVKLLAFNKESMAEVASVPLSGFEGQDELLNFHSCFLKFGELFVFRSKSTENSEQLFLEVLDAKLTTVHRQKMVYENKNCFDLKRASFKKNSSSIVVLFNPLNDGNILIGGEIPVLNDHIRFAYGLLDKELELSSINTVILPTVLKDKSYGLSSTYSYLDNGDLLLRGTFTATNEEGAKSSFVDGGILLSDVNPYHTVSYLKVKTNELLTINIQLDRVSLQQPRLRSVILDNECRVYGIYKKEEKGKVDEDGILCARINFEKLSSTVEYIAFEQKVLDSLNEIPSIGKSFDIQDVVVSKNQVSLMLIPSIMGNQYNYLIRMDGIWSKVITYDLNHKLQWITSVRTNPTNRAFTVRTNDESLAIVYSKKGAKKVGKVTISSAEDGYYAPNFIGYIELDLKTGTTLKSEEFEFVDFKPYMWGADFKNGTLFCRDGSPLEKKYTGHLIRVTIVTP